MASTLSFYIVLIALSLAISVHARSLAGNNVECENLNDGSCAYAVSSMGKRCVLEKRLIGIGYTCRTSSISAGNLRDYIETEECISTCGVDRRALGISSDSLLDRNVAQSLCSEDCYRSCPNIVDLYFNLAAGEGVYLPKFCESRKINSGRREMIEFNSVGVRADVAPQAAKRNFGNSKLQYYSDAPAPSTAFGGSKDLEADAPAGPDASDIYPDAPARDSKNEISADAPGPVDAFDFPEGPAPSTVFGESKSNADAPGPDAFDGYWNGPGPAQGTTFGGSKDEEYYVDAPAPSPDVF